MIGYEQCPAVPPELMLVPRQLPFNIYEMSAWSRTILVPLSLLWAYRPVRDVTGWCGIDELFHGRPQDLPVTMPRSETLDALSRRTWLDWDAVFRRIDRLIKAAERWRLRPLRKLAIRRAADWMLARFENSDGLGAIFPPIIWSVVALKCLGHAEDSPEVASQLRELDKLMLGDGESIRLQPCKSPVWDTAITTLALREAGTPPEHPALRQAVDWLLSKEIRTHGDWAVLGRGREPGGWPFEYRNAFYPDVDDTSMVVMALCRCLPGAERGGWDADFLFEEWSPHEEDEDVAAVLAAGGVDSETALNDLDAASPQVNAIWRGVRWVLAMQGRDGGWGAFDRDNDRELFTRVPFADHNAMIDPSTADLTARVLEMFAGLG
ncbi:MAG: squalene--hopene cyclase, partial [Planctomycetaceae bacterium]